MERYKLKNGGRRRKAGFGTDAGAILAAAGINVAGTLAAAGLGAKATKDAAKQQANATITSANKQAMSIKEQANNAKEQQQQYQEFTKEQNEENREIQRQIQLNLQMLTGQQNVNDRLAAARIQVRNGGGIRKKLMQTNPTTLLRGSNSQTNMPFVVTDGGGVIPLYTTPEGFDLYEIYGNDHEHYHKTKEGTYKTGVGFKFANGKVIEGQGNQKTKKGEYLLVTPDDAKFISKNNIKGFNPVEAVDEGMHPLEAFNTQELIKDAYNISDSGNKKTNIRRKLKDNGRTKAEYGWENAISSGIATLGNIGGAWLTNAANNKAMGYINAANNQAAGILADAYSQMKGIDLSNIRKEDYAATHAMAQLRAPISDTSAQRAAQARTLQRKLDNAKRYSLSGATMQDRMTLAETDYNDNIGRIESDADRIREQIKQQNVTSINETARLNAQLDTQANNQYANAYLNALQYNNSIKNEKLAGIAQARANSIMNNAQVAANTTQANAQAWGSAIDNSTQTIGNSIESYLKTQADRENVLLGVDAKQAYRAAMTSGDRREAQKLYTMWKDGTEEQKKWAADLDAKWNGKLSGIKTKRTILKNILPKSTNYYDIINYNNPNDNYFA